MYFEVIQIAAANDNLPSSFDQELTRDDNPPALFSCVRSCSPTQQGLTQGTVDGETVPPFPVIHMREAM